MSQNFATLNLFLLISIIAITITTFATTSLAMGYNYDDNHKGQFYYRSRFIRSLDSILNGLASLDQSSSTHRQVSRPHPHDPGYGNGGKPSRLGSVSSQYEMSSGSPNRDRGHAFLNQRARSETPENKAQGQRRLDSNFPMIPFPPELPPLSLFGIGGLPGFEDEQRRDGKGSKISSSKHNSHSTFNKGLKSRKEKGRDYDDDYNSGKEYPDSKYSPYKSQSSRGDKNKKGDDDNDEVQSPRKEVASSPAPFYPSHGPAPQELRLPMFSFRRGQGYHDSTPRSSLVRNLPLKGKHDSINSVLNEEYELGTGLNFRGFHRLPAEIGGSSRYGHSEQGSGEGYPIQGLTDPRHEKNQEADDGYPSHGGQGLDNTHGLRNYEGHGAYGSGDGHSSYGGYSAGDGESNYGSHSLGHGQSNYVGQTLGHGQSIHGSHGVGHHLPTYGVHGLGQGETSYETQGYGHGQPSYNGGSGLSHGGYGLSYGGHQFSYPGLTSHHSVIPRYPSGTDYKGHQTAVNAAALQAIKSITSLDHDASFSLPGLGESGSAYNGISGFAGLYR